MCIDRAGLNFGDGVTHHGIFDVAFFSGLPNVRLYVPATYNALERAIDDALANNYPAAIRYPSGSENDTIVNEFYTNNTNHNSSVICSNCGPDTEVVIISHGRITIEAINAAAILREQGIQAGNLLLERLTPYEEIAADIKEHLKNIDSLRCITFVEEEIYSGGMGMILSRKLSDLDMSINMNFIIIAVEDPFSSPRSDETIFEHHGLDRKHIAEKIINQIDLKNTKE